MADAYTPLKDAVQNTGFVMDNNQYESESRPRRLSARGMFYTKRVFPAIFLGIPSVMCLVVLLFSIMNRDWSGLVALIVFGFMIGFGLLVMKKLVFDLVDEVWDEGDYLLIKNKKLEDRISLTSIINVNYLVCNPPRITLTLRQPCRFGTEITFTPLSRPSLFRPFAKPPIVQELIERVDAARRGSE